MSLTPTQTTSRSMARVRRYKESDLSRLEELFRKNYPIMLTPDLRGENSDLNLVLENARGELQMAMVGGGFLSAFPLIDPKSRVEREDFGALLAAAEQELCKKGLALNAFVLWLPEDQLHHRLLLESLGFVSFRNTIPYAKVVVGQPATEKKQ